MTVEAPTRPPQVARAGPRHRRRRRRLPGWITVVLWIVTGGMAVVAAMRLFAWDAYQPFAVLNTVTEFIYLPAWIIAVVAVLGRRYALAVAALVIVALQVTFMLPELTAGQPLPAWTSGAPTVHLLDGNVYAQNGNMGGYADQIIATRPDLVTLEEANPRDVRLLTGAGALTELPYTVEVKRWDPGAYLLASKYPLTGISIVYRGGYPVIVKSTLHLPSGPVALWVVHTVAPLPQSFAIWKSLLDTIDQQIRARGTSHLMVVGDFNATWGNKGFRTILDSGLTDGAAARGEPFDFTWSQQEQPLPPLVRIDHVLTGPGVAVTAIHAGPGPGSDHRDLTATIAVHR